MSQVFLNKIIWCQGWASIQGWPKPWLVSGRNHWGFVVYFLFKILINYSWSQTSFDLLQQICTFFQTLLFVSQQNICEVQISNVSCDADAISNKSKTLLLLLYSSFFLLYFANIDMIGFSKVYASKWQKPFLLLWIKLHWTQTAVNFDRDSLSLQELKEAILKLSKPWGNLLQRWRLQNINQVIRVG